MFQSLLFADIFRGDPTLAIVSLVVVMLLLFALVYLLADWFTMKPKASLRHAAAHADIPQFVEQLPEHQNRPKAGASQLQGVIDGADMLGDGITKAVESAAHAAGKIFKTVLRWLMISRRGASQALQQVKPAAMVTPLKKGTVLAGQAAGRAWQPVLQFFTAAGKGIGRIARSVHNAVVYIFLLPARAMQAVVRRIRAFSPAVLLKPFKWTGRKLLAGVRLLLHPFVLLYRGIVRTGKLAGSAIARFTRFMLRLPGVIARAVINGVTLFFQTLFRPFILLFRFLKKLPGKIWDSRPKFKPVLRSRSKLEGVGVRRGSKPLPLGEAPKPSIEKLRQVPVGARVNSTPRPLFRKREPAGQEGVYNNYDPVNYYVQIEPWHYPCVRMPQHNRVRLLYPGGEAASFSPEAGQFVASLAAVLEGAEVTAARQLSIGTRVIELGAVVCVKDGPSTVLINLEFDSPRSAFIENRDTLLTENGWIVVRFREDQVKEQADECLAFVARVIRSVIPEFMMPPTLSKKLHPAPKPQFSSLTSIA